MEGADLIACVYPHEDVGEFGEKAIIASWLGVPPRRQQRARYRESAEPLPGDAVTPGVDDLPRLDDLSRLNYLPHLEVRFSDIPRTDYGVVFGSSPACDVVLDDPHVTGCHFSITFDHLNRPIVRDWGSLVGTEVTYTRPIAQDQGSREGTTVTYVHGGSGARSDFRWIVGGHRVPQEATSIIINIPQTVSFRICVAHHDITSRAYIDSVNSFRQGTATAEDLFNDLSLPRRVTELPSGAKKPGKGKLYLRKLLGQGAFGVVNHVWSVSKGCEFALKEPTAEAIAAGRVDKAVWEREARLMGQVSHVRMPPDCH